MSELKYCNYCYPNCKGHRTIKVYYFSTLDIDESDHAPFEWDIINYYLNKKMHESWELVSFAQLINEQKKAIERMYNA